MGHPVTRPAHAFALQAIGRRGTTAKQLSDALGISKQGAAKMVDELEQAGYVTRDLDPADGRRGIITLTNRALEFLELSAGSFDEITEVWRRTLGERRFEQLLDDLERVALISRPDRTLLPLRPIW